MSLEGWPGEYKQPAGGLTWYLSTIPLLYKSVYLTSQLFWHDANGKVLLYSVYSLQVQSCIELEILTPSTSGKYFSKLDERKSGCWASRVVAKCATFLVSLLSRPGKVSPNSRPGKVSPHIRPEKVSPHSRPGKVSPHIRPGKVSPHIRPGKVSPHIRPGKVSPHIRPRQISLHITPGKVSLRVRLGKVSNQSWNFPVPTPWTFGLGHVLRKALSSYFLLFSYLFPLSGRRAQDVIGVDRGRSWDNPLLWKTLSPQKCHKFWSFWKFLLWSGFIHCFLHFLGGLIQHYIVIYRQPFNMSQPSEVSATFRNLFQLLQPFQKFFKWSGPLPSSK